MSALTVLLLGVGSALGVPLQPPPTKTAPGPHAPFDLTYLTRPGPCVVAVRPNELVKAFGDQAKPAGESLRRVVAAVFALHDGNLKAAPVPALADVSEVVAAVHLGLRIETEKDGTGTFGITSVSGGVIRTTKPFDWNASVRKWFPTAKPVKRAGRTYLRVPGAEDDSPAPLTFFVPDARTLVFDSEEDRVKHLLDLLADGQKPAPPPGWDAVKRETVAVCHDPAAEGWLTAPDRPARPIDQALVAVARGSTGLALGISAGEKTSLRVVATTADDKAAKQVRSALKSFFVCVSEDEDAGPLGALLGQMTTGRDGATVTAHGSVPGNLLRRLLGADAEQ